MARTGVVTCQLPNDADLRMQADDDPIANNLYWHGWKGFEPETVGVFLALAAESRTILDIGANSGYFAIAAGLTNPGSRVLAFEPLPSCAARIARNVTLNPVTNVECVCMALSDGGSHRSQEFFYFQSDVLPSSSSLSRDFMARAASWLDRHHESACVWTGTTSLDECAANWRLEGVDLVKLDVETHEPAVLRGMRGVLERDRPHLVVEVLGTEAARALGGIIDADRYGLYLLTSEGPQRRQVITSDPVWRNWLFVPQGRELPPNLVVNCR